MRSAWNISGSKESSHDLNVRHIKGELPSFNGVISYVILGLAVSGLIRVFLNPASVANHLGKGRFSSVFKAALLGIPLPLCSCGVLPAAISLKKQGANNGATTAFLISTPETGVDSISITYALLDPMLTIVRPLAAFISAISAGFAENIFHGKNIQPPSGGDLSCPVDGCCDGLGRPPEGHKAHHSILEKIGYGVRYAFSDVWNDMAPWFAFGLLLAGAITVFIPEEALAVHLGGGVPSMLIMLVLGIPIYICATASNTYRRRPHFKRRQSRCGTCFSIGRTGNQRDIPNGIAGYFGKTCDGHLPCHYRCVRRHIRSVPGSMLWSAGYFGKGCCRAFRRINTHRDSMDWVRIADRVIYKADP